MAVVAGVAGVAKDLVIDKGKNELSKKIKSFLEEGKAQNELIISFKEYIEKCESRNQNAGCEVDEKFIKGINSDLLNPSFTVKQLSKSLGIVWDKCIISEDKNKGDNIKREVCESYLYAVRKSIEMYHVMDGVNTIEEKVSKTNEKLDKLTKTISDMNNEKKSNIDFDEKFKENGNMGILGVFEEESFDIDIINEDRTSDISRVKFFGMTIDYSINNLSKYYISFNIHNVGNAMLNNIIIKNFNISRIDFFENESFSYTEIFSSDEKKIINGCVLPGAKKRLVVVFDINEEENLFDLIENDEFDMETNEVENSEIDSWSDYLMVEFEFIITKANKTEFEQKFILLCSEPSSLGGRYKIETVDESFN